MKHACSLGLALWRLSVPLTFLSGSCPGSFETRRLGLNLARGIDFKVITWFRRDQPLATFKYQIYDVRKGEYTPAVHAWLELMRTKHPAYEVTVAQR